MALSSMTGFARSHGVSGAYAWAWEIKSVNAKGLDLRLRLPPGWDALEAPARKRGTEKLSRGTVYANLTIERKGAAPRVTINEAVLSSVLDALKNLESRIEAAAPTLDGILGIKGVMDVSDDAESEDARRAAEADVGAGFVQALDALVAMRRDEGRALESILSARLGEIATLAKRADDAPGRRPDAVKAKLKEQIAVLLDEGVRLDPDRLHQEALLLAAKADIREELDRLHAHVTQAQKLIAAGGPAGRKLDFLSQELNRESNTLCAKSNDVDLTNIGLELKGTVEQFREQVQNLE